MIKICPYIKVLTVFIMDIIHVLPIDFFLSKYFSKIYKIMTFFLKR